MKTCVYCDKFNMDVERPMKFRELSGKCNGGYVIENFNAEECDGFCYRQDNPYLIDGLDWFPDPVSHGKEPFRNPGYTIDRWKPKEG